jgi:hypothetical protein
MKYIPLIFSGLGTICSILLAIHCSFNNQNNEATAWGVGAIWATNCVIYDLINLKNGN